MYAFVLLGTYSAFWVVVLVFVAPFLICYFVFNPQNARILAQRLWPFGIKPLLKDGIWFHGASLGEIKACEVLLEAFDRHDIRLTTTTHTGLQLAKSYTPHVALLPCDLWSFWWVRPQKVLVIIEAEYWPLMAWFAHKRGAKVILVNARSTSCNLRKYAKIKALMRLFFAQVDEVYCQSPQDAKRLHWLGARHIQVMGNLKSGITPKVQKHYHSDFLPIIAASTHQGEEALIAKAFAQVCAWCDKPLQLIVAPRHDYRFKSVDAWLSTFAKDHQLSYAKLSTTKTLQTQVVLIDAIGVLNDFYALGGVVIMGGSWIASNPQGGHNPIEPAYFGCSIIAGSKIHDQRQAFACIDPYVIGHDPKDLASTLMQVLEHGQGATIINRAKTQDIIETLKRICHQSP